MANRFLSGSGEGWSVNNGIPVALSAEIRTGQNSAGAPAPRTQSRVARLRPKLGVADLLLQLWRAKWLMLLVFVSILLIGVAITLITPTKYAASTRLLVRLGQEYVFDPVIGDAGKGAFLQQEERMQAEAELVRSPVIAERVILSIGLGRLYPNFAQAKLRARDRDVYVIDQKALEVFAADLDVISAPKSAILHLTYAHEDPALAAATLNRFVTEYLKYRQEVLSSKGVAGLTEQRGITEGRLADADKALRDFLDKNGLSDFDAESAAAKKRFADISDELTKVQASLHEAEAKSASLGRQLETHLKSTSAQGLRRNSPNAVRQALEADRAVQTANISALTGRTSALATQKREAETRIAHLAALEPDYLRLQRDRSALEASAGALATREQAERARNELATRGADNISVYEAARPPTQGDASKRVIAIAAAILGLIAAVVVGLLRAWSITGFASAGSVERTLGLRVLATAKDRAT